MTIFYETLLIWVLYIFTPLNLPFVSKETEKNMFIDCLMDMILYTFLVIAAYDLNVNGKLENYYDPIIILLIILILMDKFVNLFLSHQNYSLAVLSSIGTLILAIVLLALTAVNSQTLPLAMFVFVIAFYLIKLYYEYTKMSREKKMPSE